MFVPEKISSSLGTCKTASVGAGVADSRIYGHLGRHITHFSQLRDVSKKSSISALLHATK